MPYPPCTYCLTPRQIESEGQIYCINGHHLGPADAVPGDEEAFGRRGNVVRRKIERGEKRSKVLRGERGRRLFLVAAGWVVWRVCWEVVEGGLFGGGRKGMGKGKGRGEDEGGDGLDEGNGEDEEAGSGQRLWEVIRALWELRVERVMGTFSVDERGSNGQEEKKDEVQVDSEGEEGGRKTAMKATDNPTLMDIATLIYVGLLILRYPLDLRTFYGWLETERLPFLRVIRHVPKDIRDRLPAEYQHALDTTTLPTIDDLRLAVSNTTVMYSSTFGVAIPPLNHQPVLLSYIETLALPLQMYSTVKHLNTIVGFDFAYPNTSSRRATLSYPEVQLMSLMVVATKLLFPFDSTKRFPRSLNDPGAFRMDWNTWLAAKSDFDSALSSSESSIKPGTHMALKDTDILDMSDEQLDEYMDWYQRMWMNPERREEGVKQKILDLFPVRHLPEETMEERLAKESEHEGRVRGLKRDRVVRVMGALKARRAVSDEEEMEMIEQGVLEKELLRPGMRFEVFRDVSSLESVAKTFHEEAAETVGISVEALVRAVRSVESKVEKWRREQRRAALYGEPAEDSAEEAVDIDMDDADAT